jgi:hypothetical protein
VAVEEPLTVYWTVRLLEKSVPLRLTTKVPIPLPVGFFSLAYLRR